MKASENTDKENSQFLITAKALNTADTSRGTISDFLDEALGVIESQSAEIEKLKAALGDIKKHADIAIQTEEESPTKDSHIKQIITLAVKAGEK